MSAFHDKTINAARNKWRGTLIQLGVSGDFLTKKPGPCPICQAGEDRFVFDDKEGRGTSFCRQCGARDGMKLAMDFLGLPFAEAAAKIDAIVGNLRPDAGKHSADFSDEETRKVMRRLYMESTPLAPGDLAHRYLEARGIASETYPDTLRFHPRARDGNGGECPTLISLVGVPGEPKFIAMHRTFLRPDGKAKAEMAAPRKLLGSLADGSCIRLGPANAELGIAEGIETALSASALFGLPVWAAISAANMVKWLPPEGVESVTIFGDADASYTGQSAAYTLAHRIVMHAKKAAREIEVIVKMPPALGWDWNDVLLAEQGRKSA